MRGPIMYLVEWPDGVKEHLSADELRRFGRCIDCVQAYFAGVGATPYCSTCAKVRQNMKTEETNGEV